MTILQQYIGDLEDWEKVPQDLIDADMEQFDDVVDWSALDDYDFEPDVTITNEAGGSQSRIATRLDLIPADVQLLVGMVLSDGAEKYGEENWKLIPAKDHMAHALEHLTNHLHHNETEQLIHALCRIYFTAHMFMKEQP